MARRHADTVAVICPNDGYADRGYVGMPCPDCGTPMVEDLDVLDHERVAAGIGGGEEPLDSASAGGSLEEGEDPYRMSLEEMAYDELKDDEGEEHF